jgi:hypothetical protein
MHRINCKSIIKLILSDFLFCSTLYVDMMEQNGNYKQTTLKIMKTRFKVRNHIGFTQRSFKQVLKEETRIHGHQIRLIRKFPRVSMHTNDN